jgi:hypothetical protein
MLFMLASCGGDVTPTAVLPTATKAPTAKPTVTPTKAVPTAKPIPSETTLGQPLSHFTARYGKPNDHSTTIGGLYHLQRYAGSNLDFLVLQADVFNAGYEQSIMGITAQAPDAGWTSAKADSTCADFLPHDAVYKNQAPLTTGNGYDKVYFSVSLASLFPASAFVDAGQNQIQAGTFDVLYIQKSQSDVTIVSCALFIGTQQAA